MFCYKAIQLGKVKFKSAHTLNADHRQGTLDHFIGCPEMSKARKKQRLLEDTVKDTQMDFQFLQARHDGDVEFIDVFRLKKNLNHTKLPFSGPGKAKLLM